MLSETHEAHLAGVTENYASICLFVWEVGGLFAPRASRFFSLWLCLLMSSLHQHVKQQQRMAGKAPGLL